MTLESTRPIDLYSLDTPNGQKVNIALEELGLKYTPHTINISKGEQFAPDFLNISPNNKIPAIVDHVKLAGGGDKDGEQEVDIPVFESVAILIYLAEKTGRADLLPSLQQDPLRRKDILEWSIWQCAGFVRVILRLLLMPTCV
jgi:GSH-dependent disulfide-bond oxidoreductase